MFRPDQPDLLDEIRRRRTTAPVKLAPRPAAEQATIASLQARLTSTHEELTRLNAENRTLPQRLSVALGDAWHPQPACPPTPRWAARGPRP